MDTVRYAVGFTALIICLILAIGGVMKAQQPSATGPVVFVWVGEEKDSTEEQMNEIGVSLREVECLARNIYHEARGESTVGQVAVAYVTLNRVAKRRWGDDVCEVVWKPHQFSWTASPTPVKDSRAWKRSWEIALAVLKRQVANPIGQADHYHADSVHPGWAKKMKKVAKLGHHIFYF